MIRLLHVSAPVFQVVFVRTAARSPESIGGAYGLAGTLRSTPPRLQLAWLAASAGPTPPVQSQNSSGPPEMVSATLEPGATSTPPAGLLLMTWSIRRTSLLLVAAIEEVNPAAAIVAAANALSMPTTSGTLTPPAIGSFQRRMGMRTLTMPSPPSLYTPPPLTAIPAGHAPSEPNVKG
ncbi:MAG: hypothetical protein BWZ10_02515 [candidate division BRC1 bacterium ADurb.BinA364]|nr:MAG: hypothetical protein BWZ10_02515 [candidate division BRC1 bacterium ADurb.BinA364]